MPIRAPNAIGSSIIPIRSTSPARARFRCRCVRGLLAADPQDDGDVEEIELIDDGARARIHVLAEDTESLANTLTELVWDLVYERPDGKRFKVAGGRAMLEPVLARV